MKILDHFQRKYYEETGNKYLTILYKIVRRNWENSQNFPESLGKSFKHYEIFSQKFWENLYRILKKFIEN